jgi:hypothetical protein
MSCRQANGTNTSRNPVESAIPHTNRVFCPFHGRSFLCLWFLVAEFLVFMKAGTGIRIAISTSTEDGLL